MLLVGIFFIQMFAVMGQVQKSTTGVETSMVIDEVRGFTTSWLEAMDKDPLPFLRADTEISITCDLPFCGKYTGPSGAAEMVAKTKKTFAVSSARSEIVAVSEPQYSAIAKFEMTGQCRETGAQFEAEMIHLMEFDISGKIKKSHCFPKDPESFRMACISKAEKKFWAFANALFSIEVLHDQHPIMDLISPSAEFHIKVSPSTLLTKQTYVGHSGFLQVMAESQRTKWMMMKAKPLLFMLMKAAPKDTRILHSDDNNVFVMMKAGDFIVYAHMVFEDNLLAMEEIHMPRTVKPWELHKHPKVPMDLWPMGDYAMEMAQEEYKPQALQTQRMDL